MQTTTNLGLKKPEENDFYNVEDFNDNMDILDEKVQECFQSVSNGKKLVANAITDKGVSTSETATFATMASNIGNIKTNPTLQSKTASLSTSSQTIKPDSGYDGLSQVTVPAISGNAAQGDVLSGKTFNSATAGVGKSGTMANKGETTVDASAVTSDSNYTYLTIPANGYYNTNSKVRTLNSNLENKCFVVGYANGNGGKSVILQSENFEISGNNMIVKKSGKYLVQICLLAGTLYFTTGYSLVKNGSTLKSKSIPTNNSFNGYDTYELDLTKDDSLYFQLYSGSGTENQRLSFSITEK